jgi:hypothetical protein
LDNYRRKISAKLDEQSGMCFLLLAIKIKEESRCQLAVSLKSHELCNYRLGAHQQVRRSPIGMNQTEIFIGFIHYHVGN